MLVEGTFVSCSSTTIATPATPSPALAPPTPPSFSTRTRAHSQTARQGLQRSISQSQTPQERLGFQSRHSHSARPQCPVSTLSSIAARAVKWGLCPIIHLTFHARPSGCKFRFALASSPNLVHLPANVGLSGAPSLVLISSCLSFDAHSSMAHQGGPGTGSLGGPPTGHVRPPRILLTPADPCAH